MICFKIIESSKTKKNKYGDSRQAWTKISRKFKTTTADSWMILCNKFAKSELDDVTRDPEDLITALELLRGDL